MMTEKYSNEQLEMLIQSIIESENPSALAIIAEQGFYHEQLMMSENEHIRAIVAKYTDNVKFLKALATDTDINICKNILNNSNCTHEVEEILAQNNNPYCRSEVAKKTNNQDILRYLAKDKDWWVQSKVAENEKTPPDVLEELSKHIKWEVREEVAKNANTAEDTLEALSFDKDEEVYFALALNIKTSTSILERLMEKEMSSQDKRELCVLIAMNPNLSEELFKQFAKSPDYRLREAVASNENIPANLLSVLARDNRNDVRMNVACNKNTDAKTLDFLLEEKDFLIASAIARNPNLPIDLLPKLFKVNVRLIDSMIFNNSQIPDKGLLPVIKERWDDIDFIYNIAEYSNRAAILTALAKHESQSVRCVVSNNSNTPTAVLTEMKNDVCDTVRHIANRQLENRAIKERKTAAKER